jgi:hypothetical protein
MSESGEPLNEIASQFVVIQLVEVLYAKILKGTLSLQQVITGNEQSVADGHDSSFAAPFGRDSLEECSKVAFLSS